MRAVSGSIGSAASTAGCSSSGTISTTLLSSSVASYIASSASLNSGPSTGTGGAYDAISGPSDRNAELRTCQTLSCAEARAPQPHPARLVLSHATKPRRDGAPAEIGGHNLRELGYVFGAGLAHAPDLVAGERVENGDLGVASAGRAVTQCKPKCRGQYPGPAQRPGSQCSRRKPVQRWRGAASDRRHLAHAEPGIGREEHDLGQEVLMAERAAHYFRCFLHNLDAVGRCCLARRG